MGRPYFQMTDSELVTELRHEAAQLEGTKTAAGLLSSARLLESETHPDVLALKRQSAIGQLHLMWYIRQDIVKGRAA